MSCGAKGCSQLPHGPLCYYHGAQEAGLIGPRARTEPRSVLPSDVANERLSVSHALEVIRSYLASIP